MHPLSSAEFREILAVYEGRDGNELAGDPDACASIVQRALASGEPLLAYDICAFGLGKAPHHLRLRQLQGLALARCGAAEQARQRLENLYSEGFRDEETLGILARTYKDLWSRQAHTSVGKKNLIRSQQLYEESYTRNGGYWSGINAATLASAAGDAARSNLLATQVRNECIALEEKPEDISLWRSATLGEAALLLGDLTEARYRYTEALEKAGLGDRASMYRNARMAIEGRKLDLSFLDEVFPTTTVAVFSGHRIDEEGRANCRFPESSGAAVFEAIKARLERSGVRVGYASAASGGDIVFHEAMLDLGSETHVVLPGPPEEFAAGSVASAGAHWLDRYNQVLRRAASVIVHSRSLSGNIGYAYNNWVALGLARSRARQLGGQVLALALWDGKPGLPGGTSDAVRDWLEYGEQVEWLAPLDLGSPWKIAPGRPTIGSAGRSIGRQRIVSMLFADAVGFSELSDGRVLAFVDYFLGAVARVLREQEEPPLTRNTWGDGLFLCFATPRAAGRFALDLSDAVRTLNWSEFGLPASLSLRIALHCGPAHEVFDPVVEQKGFAGEHVSRAARIEPVTPPGSVYCSQSFAALCECEQISDFTCDYVGRMPLAKKFGEHPMFAVTRRSVAADLT
jgi:class 3 adenylate cyclase